jgi:hypothetical protein
MILVGIALALVVLLAVLYLIRRRESPSPVVSPLVGGSIHAKSDEE